MLRDRRLWHPGGVVFGHKEQRVPRHRDGKVGHELGAQGEGERQYHVLRLRPAGWGCVLG